MNERPRISITLVTRNRPESLERALASIRSQDREPWELLVSDDSDEARAREVRRVAEHYGARYFRGPRRGLYANRNACALAAHGTHVRTMDDDHELPPGNLAACERAARSDPDAVWVMNETVPGHGGIDARSLCPPQLHPRGFSIPPPDPNQGWPIADGATIYPAAIFGAGHRFAEEFLFGASYLEFGSYLWSQGYRMRHLNDAYVVHHFTPGGRSYELPVETLGSRMFAMTMHSFYYQRSARNVALTIAEIVLMAVRQPITFWRAVPRAAAASRWRRQPLVGAGTGP